MRFTSVLVAGAFAAMASAQGTATASLSPAQQSQIDCIDACDAGDVKCQSYCITVPSPNEKQVNATNECVAGCPKGKGSEADTQKYAACLQDCVADNYWKTVDGTPRETAASGSSDDEDKDSSSKAGSKATATGTDADSTAAASASASSDSDDDASETASESEASGTASGTAASSTETGNAAPALVGGVSLLGLFAAVLAL
ncbi:hypothetical protein NCS57_00099800 [Fusarium keratoplasticum]|uniref:Uncharacterized protein n=1 Tax=Fusarium keratoplasticum TaxID=1328300 RepID=A0ACC0RG66_9HYPO|nr:hypothetical protein NCS57_00099800 [Fusarium keratoplasticum]KAI8684338.1 hypothetical protein NCS57_00099800 [Fusarium keratoplasticum]KAI8688451.1 hypothetical protein NCS55_00098900 [Fusarium keratoplasticum]